MSGYGLRPVVTDDAGIRRMATLLRSVFPDARHFTDEVLRWQYHLNPNGRAVGTNAWAGEELGAHYVTIPFQAVLDGRSEKGLLSLNTATHPAHQGKGLFTQLANATYERATAEGYGFVIGVANANSTHGFTKKLGFQLVAPLRAMIGVGRLPLVTDAAEPRYAQRWDQATLAWRLAHPAHRYSARTAAGVGLILSERSQFGARYVVAAQCGAFAGIQAPVENGSVPAKVWIGLDPTMRWSGAAYVNIPMRFRPSPLNLIFKDLSGSGRRLDPAGVRFHAIDFDIL